MSGPHKIERDVEESLLSTVHEKLHAFPIYEGLKRLRRGIV